MFMTGPIHPPGNSDRCQTCEAKQEYDERHHEPEWWEKCDWSHCHESCGMGTQLDCLHQHIEPGTKTCVARAQAEVTWHRRVCIAILALVFTLAAAIEYQQYQKNRQAEAGVLVEAVEK